MAGEVRVGTSGWQYDHWRGTVYPEDLPKRRWLEHYATRFPTVEVNATFYRLARASTVEQWAQTVPPEFELAFKGSRYLTHQRKLREPDDALSRFFAPLEPARDRTAVVLWQLPGGWRRDLGRLEAFLAALPRTVRHAVELRDDDWFCDETYEVLARHDVALVWLSSGLTRAHELVATGGHRYVRFHGLDPDEPYVHDYAHEELAPWAEVLAEAAAQGAPSWVFFNNDAGGHAVRNAEALIDLLGEAARPWPPTLT